MSAATNPLGIELEIATLRQSLQEAHDVCQAIRTGQVDAVVVGQGVEKKKFKET